MDTYADRMIGRGSAGPRTASEEIRSVAENTVIDAAKRVAAVRDRLGALRERGGRTRDRLMGDRAEAQGPNNENVRPRPCGGALGDLAVQIDGLWSDLDALEASFSGLL